MGWFGEQVVNVVVEGQFQVKCYVVGVVVDVVWQIDEQWVIGIDYVFCFGKLCFQVFVGYGIVEEQCV